jgi:hypothetical protein
MKSITHTRHVMKSISRTLTVAQYQALISGIQQHLTTGTITVASQTFTGPEAVTFLQGLLTPATGTSTAKAAYHEAVLASRTAEAQNGAIAREMRDVIALMYSNSPTMLASFGLVPRKTPKPLSAEARAAAEAKAKATRTARGTKGKVEKAAITGNVSGVTITPVLIPTAAASSASAGTAPAPITPAPSAAAPAVAVGPVVTGTAASPHT